eukprot:CAMPEP_0184716204 /NCGR_PEP_ID=MMETSP0314-20130426/5984_1 /TAXON_ID=38298 /ORGANISM="Rhodella maculata, Strain CCMP 736" /LENGTH=45 /DNA_ID= /DNA_START= /DNA_END= /DNA_ORIENTATION=
MKSSGGGRREGAGVDGEEVEGGVTSAVDRSASGEEAQGWAMSAQT